MIIRLVDIVLILLFGFIVISDIDIKGSLSLPSKRKESVEQVAKRKRVIVFVEITPGNTFLVFRDKEKKIRQTSISSLEKYLITLRETLKKTETYGLAVVIKPHEDSEIQSTVDILDLCDRNGIPKNIARKSLTLF